MNKLSPIHLTDTTPIDSVGDHEQFRQATHDLFLGRRHGHLLPFFYSAHGGKDGRKSMAGDKKWVETTREPAYYFSTQDRAVLSDSVTAISSKIPQRLPMLDIAPGDKRALQSKSSILANACSVSEYIGLESSPTFASAAREVLGRSLGEDNVNVLEIDAFKMAREVICDRGVIYFGGCTVGGLEGAVTDSPPIGGLSEMINAIASHAREAYVVLSYADGSSNPSRLLRAYNNPASNDFKRNVIFRMADELDMKGFDPRLFEAVSIFYPQSGCVAHKLIATAPQQFTLDGIKYEIGQSPSRDQDGVLHIANSFQFGRQTVEDAAELCNMKILWHSKSKRPVKYVVLHKMMTNNNSNHEHLKVA